MLQLSLNEKIILVLHKHWYALSAPLGIIFILFLVPPVVFLIGPALAVNFDVAVATPFINLALALYSMLLLAILLLMWMDYYLDMWIITSERIIDMEQRGLFRREISEIPLRHVQDVTIEIKGILATLLKFGTIRVQTAGEREFAIKFIPRVYEAKDAILRFADQAQRKNSGI